MMSSSTKDYEDDVLWPAMGKTLSDRPDELARAAYLDQLLGGYRPLDCWGAPRTHRGDRPKGAA
jgi:hypothetical protein